MPPMKDRSSFGQRTAPASASRWCSMCRRPGGACPMPHRRAPRFPSSAGMWPSGPIFTRPSSIWPSPAKRAYGSRSSRRASIACAASCPRRSQRAAINSGCTPATAARTAGAARSRWRSAEPPALAFVADFHGENLSKLIEQAAAAGGGTVRIPAGDFVLPSALVVPANVRIVAPAAIAPRCGSRPTR